jgi:hypothetical protein
MNPIVNGSSLLAFVGVICAFAWKMTGSFSAGGGGVGAAFSVWTGFGGSGAGFGGGEEPHPMSIVRTNQVLMMKQ